jgi:UDP-GlcNAc:undecaprenyl-phosphate GlcNAc-1-phosphate transferase
LVDNPGGRKSHDGAVPLIGGLAIVPVFFGMLYVAGPPDSFPFGAILGATAFLLFVGAWDDRFHIHPWVRFIIQIGVATFTVLVAGADLVELGNLFGFGPLWMGPFSEIFSITCLVLLMNAMNMLDGMDGLAGGYSLIALFWLMMAGLDHGASVLIEVMGYLMVPLAVFLVFNARYPLHPRASVFLGDAGSLCLALLLGWLAIHLVITTPFNNIFWMELTPPVFIIWVMSVPIIETFSIFFTRARQGRSPFDADRLHLHYILKDGGMDPKWITPFILFLSFLTGGIAFLALKLGVPDYVLLYIWTGMLLGITYYRLKKFAK